VMATEEEATSLVRNLGILDTLSDDSIQEIVGSYNGFCAATEALLNGTGDLSVDPEFDDHVHGLCKHGLRSFVRDHFLRALEVLSGCQLKIEL
jgi:anaphase-promoting complex subunit 2